MMRLALTTIIFLVGLTARAYATTYYVGPGEPYQSFAQLRSEVTLEPGDIIDGRGNVFYERLVVSSSGTLGAPVTYRNFTLDGTLSIDGAWTFSNTGTYENTSAWKPYSGEAYSKEIGRCPMQVLEDGKYMFAISAGDRALSRGEYQCKDGRIYYRATDGGPPQTHRLRASRRDLEAQTGLLIISGQRFIVLDKVNVRNHLDGNNMQGSVVITKSSNIRYRSGIVTRCGTGIQLVSVADTQIGAGTQETGYSLAVTDNYYIGISIQGDATHDLRLDNLYVSKSGFYPRLSPSGKFYKRGGDGDNIGVGGRGGDISRLSIVNSLLEYSGRIGSNNGSGANIFVGTKNPMLVTQLVIKGNAIIGANGFGVTISSQVKSAVLRENILYKNASIRAGFSPLRIGLARNDDAVQRARSIVIFGNKFIANMGRGGITVASGATGLPDNAIRVTNNVFCNSSVGAGYRADLFLEDAPPYPWLEESGNVWRKKGSANDGGAVIKAGINGVAYDKHHLAGADKGFWQSESRKGRGDQVDDTDEGRGCQLAMRDLTKRLDDLPIPASINVQKGLDRNSGHPALRSTRWHGVTR